MIQNVKYGPKGMELVLKEIPKENFLQKKKSLSNDSIIEISVLHLKYHFGGKYIFRSLIQEMFMEVPLCTIAHFAPHPVPRVRSMEKALQTCRGARGRPPP